jgi:hypothetical protein
MYMARQTEITANMRFVLVDWLVEVHRRFDLTPETLYLGVHVLDAYLSRVCERRNRLQVQCSQIIVPIYLAV